MKIHKVIGSSVKFNKKNLKKKKKKTRKRN